MITEGGLDIGRNDSPMTSPGNSWYLLGRTNVCRVDHSPNCFASTSNA